MRAIRFLFGILLIIAVYEVRQASSQLSAASAQQVLDTLNLENCVSPINVRLLCLQNPYRTFDGTCNNLCNTTNGAAGQPHQRFPGLDPPTEYEQPGFRPRRLSALRPSDGSEVPLPNTRRVSNTVFENTTTNRGGPPDFTHITMTWGQFVDHDVTLTVLTPNVDCGINNAPCVINIDSCSGIDIEDDQRLAFNESAQCIPLVRSARNGDGEQTNGITPLMDGSQVYGSDKKLAESLRNPNANLGLLRVEPFITSGGQSILPPIEDEEDFCRSPNPEEKPCFIAGDVRVNENHALMAMHTLWVREHNRIARELHVLNPTWDDERLFQEARRIVIAEIQHITYNEWLAVLIPDRGRRESAGILPLSEGFFTGYDPTVLLRLFNVFSTAALRFGHTLIRDQFELLARGVAFQNQPEPVPTRDFFNPALFYEEIEAGGSLRSPYGLILRGLVGRRAQQFDGRFVPAVKERLIFEGEGFDGIVGDLPAINLERGREHGLPGYTKFREACGGKRAVTFFDIRDTISLADRNNLKKVYSTVKDIDVFVGLMLEIPINGSAFGFTLTCILERQFKDLRFGDRFWYESGQLTLEQLTEIRKSTLARIICDNANDVVIIQRNAFLPGTNSAGNNPRTFCDELDFVNLNEFREVYYEGPAEVGGEPELPAASV